MQESADTAPEYQEPDDSGEPLELAQPDIVSGNNSGLPATIIDRKPDYSRLSYTEANSRELAELARLTREKDAEGNRHEFMSLMGIDNKVHSTLKGSTNNINIDGEPERIIQDSSDGSLSINQTHTNGNSFSVKDLWLVNKNVSIKDFRLENINGEKYSAVVGSGKRIGSKIEFEEMAEKIENDLYKKPIYARLKEIREGKLELTIIDKRLFSGFILERNEEIKNLLKWQDIIRVQNTKKKGGEDDGETEENFL